MSLPIYTKSIAAHAFLMAAFLFKNQASQHILASSSLMHTKKHSAISETLNLYKVMYLMVIIYFLKVTNNIAHISFTKATKARFYAHSCCQRQNFPYSMFLSFLVLLLINQVKTVGYHR